VIDSPLIPDIDGPSQIPQTTYPTSLPSPGHQDHRNATPAELNEVLSAKNVPPRLNMGPSAPNPAELEAVLWERNNVPPLDRYTHDLQRARYLGRVR